MTTRVEKDRHFSCTAEKCVSAPPKKLAAGRKVGRCIPRRAWYVRTTDSAGRRVSISFRNESEARDAADKLAAAKKLGLNNYTPRSAAAPTVPTFKEMAEAALKLYISTNSLSPATVMNHESYSRQHLVPAFGSKPITPEVFSRLAIREFIAAQREVIKDSTLRTNLPTLGIILDYAVERGFLATNPLRGAGRLWRPKASEDVVPFTPEQVRGVLAGATAVDHDFAVLVQVMFQTGIRPGEALGFRRCDLDLERAEVHVEGTWSHNRLGPTKTRRTRVVSLLYPVSEARAVWRPEEAGTPTRKVLDGLRGLKVLPADPEGRLWNISSTKFDRLWKQSLKKAGLAFKKPHCARHTFASVLLSRGANVFRIQEAGGWRSATVLLSVYAKWVKEAAVGNAEANNRIGTTSTGSADGQ